MADEPTPTTDATDADATEAADTGATQVAEPPAKLRQDVVITDAGPCKKHIKVTVNREDIDARLDEKFSSMILEEHIQLSGFRPGKAPRRLVEKRFGKDVNDQVKGEVLMASLEQIAEDHDVAPISPPNINPSKIEIPNAGDLVYEFDVEVRPSFDLPTYKGLKLKRPIQKFGDADVDRELRRLLEPEGQIVPKPEPAIVEIGDILIADVESRDGERLLNKLQEIQIRVDPRLALKDGVADKFGERLKGAKAGDTRNVDIILSDAASDVNLRGKTIQAAFTVKDIKTVRLPELTPELLERYGAHNPDHLKEMIRAALERRLEYQQRQLARQQVLQTIDEAAKWELPQDLLKRQARTAMNRRIMEMRAAGMGDDEIRGRLRVLERDVLSSTALALKEHFVMQKIAEEEKLEVTDDDIGDEIERIADRAGESPRRVRARLEKEDMLEALAVELIERKALDLILQNAEYEDQVVGAGEEEPEVGTSEAQFTPGELNEPTAAPPDETPAEE